jgi:hypothetical protein
MLHRSPPGIGETAWLGAIVPPTAACSSCRGRLPAAGFDVTCPSPPDKLATRGCHEGCSPGVFGDDGRPAIAPAGKSRQRSPMRRCLAMGVARLFVLIGGLCCRLPAIPEGAADKEQFDAATPEMPLLEGAALDPRVVQAWEKAGADVFEFRRDPSGFPGARAWATPGTSSDCWLLESVRNAERPPPHPPAPPRASPPRCRARCGLWCAVWWNPGVRCFGRCGRSRLATSQCARRCGGPTHARLRPKC